MLQLKSLLKNGFAHIELDPILVKNITVNDKHQLRVFIQLEDNEKCKGVIVKNKTANGFDVVELDGGNSSTPFMFQITANRADQQMEKGRTAHYADLRFPDAAKHLEEQSMKVAAADKGEHEQKKSKFKKLFSK